MLSSATRSAWAKSNRDGGKLSLDCHLADSAAVAGQVWDRWLPLRTKQRISEVLPAGVDDGRILLRWLAGVHDIGKLSPAFACQVPELADVMDRHGLRMRSALSNRSALPHGLAGQVALEQFLAGYGWCAPVARTYSIVVGSHHGRPPTLRDSRTAGAQTTLLGDGLWEESRHELLAHMTETVGATGRLRDWAEVPLPVPVQVLVTAAVIVCDWIASNQDLFPLDESRSSAAAAAQAWAVLNLPDPWVPSVEVAGVDLFRRRFALPAEASICPLQAECLRLAEELTEPGLMIVEAPMGEGKTEAALLAAEVLARRFGLGGVFVALPTMATSNAMFDRVHEWVNRLAGTPGSMFLAHGKAALNPAFAELRRRGFASIGVDCGDDGVVAHAWYVGKKGPLANFVVGTIDQVLRAALKSRHVMLRHLGLANKVVVIDEVHAADNYMATYLCRCLEWLGAYRVPVVLMSATLPPAQRQSLLDAYQRGAHGGEAVDDVRAPSSYPSVTVWPANTTGAEIPASGRTTDVRIERLDDDLAVVVSRVRELVGDQGIAGIVCNTVARAQQMFAALREEGVFGEDELLLVHSRFVSSHRAVLEDRLRSLLGPPDKADRPNRFVLIGTQVIEQSLDIDLDVLITDLAPIDLLLQRIGRLHRHHRPRRPAGLDVARCLIRGVDWHGTVPAPEKGTTTIYRTARLLRAAAVLDRQPDALIRIPHDVPALVRDAYADTVAVPTTWSTAVADADADWRAFTAKQESRARDFLLGRPFGENADLRGWLTAAVPDSVDGARGQAQVRDAEDTIEAIVVRRRGDNVYTLPDLPGFGDRLIPTEGPPSTPFAKALSACTIRLPAALTNYGQMDAVIIALERNHYPGWQQSPWLAGELVLELDETSSAIVNDCRLTYDYTLGLSIERPER
ncbi:CRISPR-associated helicase Cas3' [Nocardia sp. CC227C]|uniref:CRISPR-associated helicase Cas3' n=1 Tax=Nocardia sp. CC227C TaxID=3044562 RepID=UPI00278C4B7C|nr:CRISPR-associated helicase Cas3' [Nocardia sp. CC227C]